MSKYKIDRDHLDSEEDEGQETENTNSPEEIKYLNRLHLDNINLEYKRTIEANNKNKYQFSKDVADRMPYPYQKLAIAQMNAKISSKFAEYGLVMPTGSGKTFTTSKYVCDKYINQGENVLVLAPSWEILSQHAETYCQSNKNFNNKIRILGRNNSLNAFEAYRRGERGKLVLSTPHTAINRINELEFSLLVVDEAHWGYARGLRMLPKIVEKAKRLNKPVLHMTATWNQSLQDAAKEPIFKLNYCDLSPDYLATCNIIRLDTGEKFEPQFCDKKKRTLNTKCISDISNRSVRVKKIVNKCHDAKYIKGKTMYYAGTIEEAFLAEKEFSNLGYKCGVVHSGWSSNGHKINTVLINRFRKENGLNILINVQMLTMGFDVKEIETIIVARPIQSDTLFMQICGRGARKIPRKKESFDIIDVHDVVVGDKTIRDMFEHRDVFMSNPPNGATPGSNKSDVTSIDQPIYNYSPNGSIKLIEETSLASLQGFPINDGQPFSFDFDVSWDNFGQSEEKDKKKCEHIGRTIFNLLRVEIGEEKVSRANSSSEETLSANRRLWSYEWNKDSGIKISSRVLMGEAGIIELTKAINVIQNIKQKNNLKFNSRTSCQLHLGWLRNDAHTSTLKEMHNNLEILFQEILTSNGNSKLSIKNNVVHFKALSGTDDIQLVVAWLSLCMCMLHRLQQIKTQSQSTKGPLLRLNTEEQLNAFMLSETSLALKQDSKLFEYFHSRTRPISNAS